MIGSKGVGILPTRKIIGINQTGSAMVLGGVYAVDITGSAAASTDPDSNLTSIVAVATANLRGFLVVAESAVAAGAAAVFTIVGRVLALVDGTTDVAEGDALIAQNASPNLIKQSGLFVAAGIALVPQTTNAGTLTDIFFDGWALWKCELAVS